MGISRFDHLGLRGEDQHDGSAGGDLLDLEAGVE
jgi:hypothetical protein